MDARTNCLGRVPYNSVIGFVLIFVGGSVLCGTLYTAMGRVDAYFRNHFFPIYSLQYLRVASVVNGAVALALGVLVLIFSVLVTNATRSRIYRGDRFIMGGRQSAAMFLCLTYTAVVVWLVFVVLLVVPTLCWVMFNSVCSHELAHVWAGPGTRRPGPDPRVAPTEDELRRRNMLDRSSTYVARLADYYYFRELARNSAAGETASSPLLERLSLDMMRPDLYRPGRPPLNRFTDEDFYYIFNLTNYGIYVKPWMYDPSLNYQEVITTVDEFAHFCDEIAYCGPLFACSLGGAMLILLGLTLFMASLSGYYTRLKLTKELTDFKHSISLRSPKSLDQAAYF